MSIPLEQNILRWRAFRAEMRAAALRRRAVGSGFRRYDIKRRRDFLQSAVQFRALSHNVAAQIAAQRELKQLEREATV